MENLKIRFIFASVILFSLMTAATINAAPVKFNQVVQVVNAKPGKAANSSFAQLRLSGEIITFSADDDDEDKKKKEAAQPRQDRRVITETSIEIVEEEVCDCDDIVVPGGGFPYWTLGFAAVPLLFLIPRRKERDRTPTPTPPTTPTPTVTPTPTPTVTPTPTPTVTPTPTPTVTPTPTPTITPTPTPPMTPTPTPTPPVTPTPTPTPPMTPTPTPPEPIPEPMTILLFGSGLAGVGLAARKRFGKKKKQEESED